MFTKKGKLFLIILVTGIISNINIFARTLEDNEKIRLLDSLKSQTNINMTIDISYTKEIVTTPEGVKEQKQKDEEISKEISEKTGQTGRIGSFSLPQLDGSEIRISETRQRIGRDSKLRSDTKIFANKERTETNYEATTINTGFEKNSPSYLKDHKLKQVWILKNARFAGREVLRFGKVDEKIVMDIIRICKPNIRIKISQKKEFLYNGTSIINGKTTDEIECIDLENGQKEYKISLEPNDWKRCNKIIWYDKETGSVSKIIEYQEFEKAQGNDELFPRLIIHRYFNKEGKEQKVETIKVNKVVIGQPIGEDVFKLDVPDNYTVFDMRVDPPLTIKPKIYKQ